MSAPTTKEEFFQALRENRDRPKGRATAAVAEELVDAAEAFGDPEVTVSALVELMRAYHGSGEAVKYPVAFARLLRLWDESPESFDEYESYQLFWFFKWVGTGLLSTPDVPLSSVRGWIAEMRRRYREAGHDLGPVYGLDYFVARQLGENEDTAYELWATRGRSRFSDCAACEARARAGYHFGRGEDERGLAELRPTFEGESGCDEEPHSSQALALLPLLRLGRLDEARAAHLTGYRKVRGREAELSTVGQHLEFCALTGNEARGLELLAENRGLFGFTAAPSSRLEFLTGVEVLLARLVATGHGELPCAGPLGREWTVAELRATVAAEADALAARFDARNGNDGVSSRRRGQLTRAPLTDRLNLGVQTQALAAVSSAAVPAVPAQTAATGGAAALPEDFAELVAEARRLDRSGHPRARVVWDAVLERAAGSDADSPVVDELLRGEIASELAQRAANAEDTDTCTARLREAAEHYRRAGRPARRLAAEARLTWAEATRDDAPDPMAAVEAAWPAFDAQLAAFAALAGAGEDDPEAAQELLSRKLVVRQSRVFTARHAARRANGPEEHAHWAGVFQAEARALIAEGAAAERPLQASVAYEVLAEFQALHGEPAEGEASARRALELFAEHGWGWRVPRGRLLLALALGSQGREAEAMAELERGLAEAHPETEPQELTPLHRMLGGMALRTRQYRTAVRAFSEAAARLDREGRPEQARETRWELSRALRAQGSLGDAVAVLESLLPPAPATSHGLAVAPTPAPAAAVGEGTADSATVRPHPPTAPGVGGPAPTEEPSGTAPSQADSAAAASASAPAAQDPSASPERGTDSDPRSAPVARAAGPAGAALGGTAEPARTAEAPDTEAQLTAQIRVDLANALLSLGEHRAAAAEFLQLADAVSRWPDKAPLTSAAAGAAGALALAGNWDGARAALDRALASNAEAPDLPDLTDTLRTLAVEAVDARGNDAVTEALGYLDRADALREEFAEAARAQFVSVEVDEAQCWYTRGRVHAATGEPAAALDAFEQAVAVYERAGYSDAPPRFEALRMAALVEGRGLDRADAARARLDKAAAEADAAELPDAAATLRRLRDSLG
ncbi:hypothetical protein [Streptacidiphilus monticola]|uniref:Tetratricopeptide repeat protein n=1 Tax=Streptacidiphilus monticola TaxID=2161674 RepID=A0ABW1G649_9ACTN